MGQLIGYQRSIIPACDVATINQLMDVIEATADVKGVGAYKVGLDLAIRFGLTAVVRSIRTRTKLPIIYDHQKAGNDIPELGPKFARAVKDAGANAVILFPFAGGATERSWIKAGKDAGLEVLVGGHMTHREFLTDDGGFLMHYQIRRIFEIAVACGITDFVVPGNRPGFVAEYRILLEELLGPGRFVLYAPGFISQGGDITEAGSAAGDHWHAIVGSALYDHPHSPQIHTAAKRLTAQIMAMA